MTANGANDEEAVRAPHSRADNAASGGGGDVINHATLSSYIFMIFRHKQSHSTFVSRISLRYFSHNAAESNDNFKFA